MEEPQEVTPEKPKSGRSVYRRPSVDGDGVESPKPTLSGRFDAPVSQPDGRLTSKLRSLAPTLIPLLGGFLLLLGLVLVLGRLSVGELNSVSGTALDLQRQRGAQLTTLLSIKTALGTLNNEARARDSARVRGGIQSPFSPRLTNARDEAEELLERFSGTSYANTDAGRSFASDLNSFIDITKDIRRYSLEGFAAFARLDETLEGFLRAETNRQEAVLLQTEELRSDAARRINTLTLLALLVGAVISTATVWEVQRRFRGLSRSLTDTRRERQFSHQVLEGMVNLVATIDGEDRFRTINEAFRRVFPGTRVGASVHDPLEEADAFHALTTVTAERTVKSAYRGRFLLNANGSGARTFDAFVAPLNIEGERGAILTFVDVTEAVNAENELRRRAALAAVGQATAQIAHEIKNPLGSIRLGVSMLREMVTDTEARTTIDLVERGIAHLNKLTVDITQYSSQRDLELAVVDLHYVLDGSLELVRDRVMEKRVKIERKFADLDLRGMFDADALRQVFVNLVANAIDASGDDGVVEITTARHADRARVVVADYGSGIDESTRAHLFEPFFTTKKRGTGLGLAITKKIVEQHDGTIEVESEVGVGTRFIVELSLRGESAPVQKT